MSIIEHLRILRIFSGALSAIYICIGVINLATGKARSGTFELLGVGIVMVLLTLMFSFVMNYQKHFADNNSSDIS